MLQVAAPSEFTVRLNRRKCLSLSSALQRDPNYISYATPAQDAVLAVERRICHTRIRRGQPEGSAKVATATSSATQRPGRSQLAARGRQQ